jgi:hypothetical protein
VFDIVLTPAERALLQALNALGVPYLIVEMGAALIARSARHHAGSRPLVRPHRCGTAQ